MGRKSRPAGLPARPPAFAGGLQRRLGREGSRGEVSAVAGAFALVTLAVLLTPFVALSSEIPPPTATAAVPFTLPTSQGGTYALSADLGHRPVLLEFMHPQCSHCIAVAARLEQAHVEYGSRVAFVSVAVPLSSFPEPTASQVESFRATYGHSWTYALDTQGSVSSAYGVQGTPTFFFLRADGTIAQGHSGELSQEELTQQLSDIAGV